MSNSQNKQIREKQVEETFFSRAGKQVTKMQVMGNIRLYLRGLMCSWLPKKNFL